MTARGALRAAFAVVAVGALVAATVSQWPRVSDTLADVPVPALVGGAVAMAVATFCSMLAWRAVLADLGSPLGLRDAGGVFFVGQLGKYLPGSVWPVVAQMELGRAHDVPRKRSALAGLLVLAMGLTAAGAVAALTLPWAGDVGDHPALPLAGIAGIVLLHPAVLRRLSRGALSPRGIATALGWSAAQWAAYGIGVWLVARDLAGAPEGLLPLATGGYALAWSAGFLVLFAPAGAGVREGALVLLFTPAYGAGRALGIALLARLLATIGDLWWGLAGFVRFGGAAVARGTSGQDIRHTDRASKGDRPAD